MDDFFVQDNGYGTLAFILLTGVVGIVIACAVMLWQIKVPGRIVRTLSEKKAYDEGSAITADKLGHKREGLLRFLFSENGALHKYINVTFTEKDKKGKGIYLSAAYYLCEQTRDRAELRYRKKNATTGALVAAIVFFSIAAVALYFIIPDLMKMLENFINSIKQTT